MSQRGTNLAIKVGFAALTLLLSHESVAAQSCDNLNSHIRSVAAVYSERNVCNWVARQMTADPAVSCSYEGMWRYEDDTWTISVMPVTSPEKGFIEHTVDISGPGNLLSGNYRVGYERLVSQLLLFYSASCIETPYLYLRLAHGNRKNRQELSVAGGNTEIFDPGEGWTGSFREKLYAAIRSGVEMEISRALEASEHD